jgi:hypothetical protein
MAVGGNSFPSVRKARAALKEHAKEIYETYKLLAKQAAAGGDFETAEKILWKLIEHMPEEEGERIVDASIDKKQPEQIGHKGPSIQIGVQIGGIPTQKSLPEAAIIEVMPEEVVDGKVEA